MQRKATGGPVTGHLTYIDKGAGVNLKSTGFTSLVITTTTTGTSADFTGTCTNNKTPCTFSVHVEDNGEPGTIDVFRITTSFGYSDGGPIASGNIQVF
ncbi:MAG: hypothetical protein H0V50_07210 [Thermoleophilaceae bacterium]|nr:hypothetical protein [Thermoleophilaceae bacterium]